MRPNHSNKHLPCKILIIGAIHAILIGCAAGLSQQNIDQITYSGTFSDLQQHAVRYTGEVVMIAGKIVEVNTNNRASRLTVLHLPMGRDKRPIDGDRSEGRFLVQTNDFLDPFIYKQGTPITLVATLTGSKTGKIGEYDYNFPIFRPMEIKVWTPNEMRSPRIQFGIGVGAHF